MAPDAFPREIEFEDIYNFRDLGGYRTSSGRHIAWRHIFRSAALWGATAADSLRLRQEIGLRSVIDLRDEAEIKRWKSSPLLDSSALRASGFRLPGMRYFNVSLVTDAGNAAAVQRVQDLGSTGAVYRLAMENDGYVRRLVECLHVIAEADLPLVFHCSAGKDRTGVLAACLLSVLGVDDADIVADYTLTGPHMAKHIENLSRDAEAAKFLQSLPAFMHLASAESMELFLTSMKRDYGSIRDYLMSHGADEAIFERLEKRLLV